MKIYRHEYVQVKEVSFDVSKELRGRIIEANLSITDGIQGSVNLKVSEPKLLKQDDTEISIADYFDNLDVNNLDSIVFFGQARSENRPEDGVRWRFELWMSNSEIHTVGCRDIIGLPEKVNS